MRRLAGPAVLALSAVSLVAKVARDAGGPAWPLSLALVLASLAAAAAAWLGRGRGGWLDGWRLALLLLGLWTLPAVYGRLGGDGFEYYTLLRSPVLDFDFDLENDFRGLGARPVRSSDGAVISRTPLGMALLWLPAFVLVHAVLSLWSWLGGQAAADGFSIGYQSAVTCSTHLFVFGALLVLEGILRPLYGAAVALLSVLGVWLATPLHFYMVANPFMSHGGSVLASTLFLAAWLVARRAPTPRAWLLTGLAGGLMAVVRVQDAVLLLIPLIDLLPSPAAARLSLLARFALGVLPFVALQVAAWLAQHGMGFVRVVMTENWVGGGGGPEVLEVLFAARHGLFTWTPVYLAAVAGWLLWLRRDARLAVLFWLSLGLAVFVNSLLRDWWGSASFGQRRLLSLTPLFALGLAETLAWLRARPLLLPGLALAAAIAWNLQFEYIYNSEILGAKNQGVTLGRLAQAQVDVLWREVMRRERWLPRRLWFFLYDNLRGVWVDAGPHSLNGLLDLGSPDDHLFVGDVGWYRAEAEHGTTFRRARGGRSPLAVPVRRPSNAQLVVQARSELGEIPLKVAVDVNGITTGEAPVSSSWAEHIFRVEARTLRPGFNRVVLVWSTTPRQAIAGHQGRNAPAAVDSIRFRTPER